MDIKNLKISDKVSVDRKKSIKEDKTLMWCECCGKKVKRWDIEMVVPEPTVFDICLLDPTVEFNFACPVCVTELELVPMQTKQAKQFRERNKRWRDAVEPQIIH